MVEELNLRRLLRLALAFEASTLPLGQPSKRRPEESNLCDACAPTAGFKPAALPLGQVSKSEREELNLDPQLIRLVP